MIAKHVALLRRHSIRHLLQARFLSAGSVKKDEGLEQVTSVEEVHPTLPEKVLPVEQVLPVGEVLASETELKPDAEIETTPPKPRIHPLALIALRHREEEGVRMQKLVIALLASFMLPILYLRWKNIFNKLQKNRESEYERVQVGYGAKA